MFLSTSIIIFVTRKKNTYLQLTFVNIRKYVFLDLIGCVEVNKYVLKDQNGVFHFVEPGQKLVIGSQ